MANTWMNSDGLYLKTGSSEGVLSSAGEYDQDGPIHTVELTIFDMTTITASPVIQDDVTFIPKNARIDRVDVIAETLATGATAVLNVGLYRYDRTTAIDAQALVAAIPVTSIDTAGETTQLTKGSTYAGTLIGTTLTNPGYISADYDTAAFTAGKVLIRVYYRFPVTNVYTP